MNRNLRVVVSHFHWGVLRTISDGSITCVMHPEHYAAIDAMTNAEDENGHVEFQDEQGISWKVRYQMQDDSLRFQTNETTQLVVGKSRLESYVNELKGI